MTRATGEERVILLTGTSGFVGAHVVRRLSAEPSTRVVRIGRAHGSDRVVDLTDLAALHDAVIGLRPTHVVHLAAIASIAACEADPLRAVRVNAEAPAAVAHAAAEVGARMIHFSTDQIFDGEDAPYSESAAARPLHRYGTTKAHAEDLVLAAVRDVVILRTALVFGRSAAGTRSPDEQICAAAAAGRTYPLFQDEFRTPVAVRWLAEAVAELIDHPFTGVLNAAGPERVSRVEFGRRVCTVSGLDPEQVVFTCTRADAGPGPARPRDVSLSTALVRRIVRAPHASLCDELSRSAASLE